MVSLYATTHVAEFSNLTLLWKLNRDCGGIILISSSLPLRLQSIIPLSEFLITFECKLSVPLQFSRCMHIFFESWYINICRALLEIITWKILKRCLVIHHPERIACVFVILTSFSSILMFYLFVPLLLFLFISKKVMRSLFFLENAGTSSSCFFVSFINALWRICWRQL